MNIIFILPDYSSGVIEVETPKIILWELSCPASDETTITQQVSNRLINCQGERVNAMATTRHSSQQEYPIRDKILRTTVSSVCLCGVRVCVLPSHLFWTSSLLDIQAGVTQEEGHTGFLIHLLSAVHAFIFLARRIQPFFSLVDREVELCVLTNY